MKETRNAVEFDRNGKPTGRHYYMDQERMRSEGLPPEQVMGSFIRMLRFLKETGRLLIAHGGYQFLKPFVESYLRKAGEREFDFDGNFMIDTGMFAKAAQVGELPWAGDEISDFCERVMKMRSPGISWNLDRYCLNFYGNDDYLEKSRLKDASYVAELTRMLFERFLRLARTEPIHPVYEE
jgi:hypothetical protein